MGIRYVLDSATLNRGTAEGLQGLGTWGTGRGLALGNLQGRIPVVYVTSVPPTSADQVIVSYPDYVAVLIESNIYMTQNVSHRASLHLARFNTYLQWSLSIGASTVGVIAVPQHQ